MYRKYGCDNIRQTDNRQTDRQTDRKINKGRSSGDVVETELSKSDTLLALAWLAFRARNHALAFGLRSSRFALATTRLPTGRYQALAFGSLSNEPLAGLSCQALALVSGLNLGLNSSLNLGLNPG